MTIQDIAKLAGQTGQEVNPHEYTEGGKWIKCPRCKINIFPSRIDRHLTWCDAGEETDNPVERLLEAMEQAQKIIQTMRETDKALTARVTRLEKVVDRARQFLPDLGEV